MEIRLMSTLFLLDDDKILLMKKENSIIKDESSYQNIGGHFNGEDNNDPYVCLIRELKEETGLFEDDIENTELKYITHRLKGDEIRMQYIYIANLLSKNKTLKESSEGSLEWISFDDIDDTKMSIVNRNCFMHFRNIGWKDRNVYTATTTTVEDENQLMMVKLTDLNAKR